MLSEIKVLTMRAVMSHSLLIFNTEQLLFMHGIWSARILVKQKQKSSKVAHKSDCIASNVLAKLPAQQQGTLKVE